MEMDELTGRMLSARLDDDNAAASAVPARRGRGLPRVSGCHSRLACKR